MAEVPKSFPTSVASRDPPRADRGQRLGSASLLRSVASHWRPVMFNSVTKGCEYCYYLLMDVTQANSIRFNRFSGFYHVLPGYC
jgi:hypothetical protein